MKRGGIFDRIACTAWNLSGWAHAERAWGGRGGLSNR